MPWIFTAGASVLVHHVERDTKDAWEAYRNMCLTCYLLCFSVVLLIIFLLTYKLTPIHRNSLKSLLPFCSLGCRITLCFSFIWKEEKKLKYLSLRVFLWIIFSIDDKDWWGDISKKGALPWQITAWWKTFETCWLSVNIYILYIEICWQKKSLRCIFLGQ